MKFTSVRLTATVATLWLVAMGLPRPAPAQVGATGTATEFSIAEHFKPPHQRQMKFQLTGSKGQPLGSGKYLVTQPRIQSFRTNGEVVLIVEAPDCVYDSNLQEASSPGHLRVRTGDEKFLIEGDGFLWRGENSTVTISNNINSEIRQSATNMAAGTKSPMVITSGQFEFNLETYTGIYRDQVQGEDATNKFSCGTLTVSTSTNGQVIGQSFDRLVAEPDAVFMEKKPGGRAASAQRAIYTRASETMELLGKATWKQGAQEGRADRAFFRQSDNSFDAIGNVAMKLPKETVGLGGFFSPTTNPPAKVASKNPALVDVFADRFQSRSNFSWSVAEGSVRVVDATNRLSCDKLTVLSVKGASSNDTATADGNVVVIQGDENHRIRSRRAVYTKADERIVFSGNPDWKMEPSEGRAELLTIHKPTGEIRATGGVTAKVTTDSKQGGGLNLFPQSSDTNQTTRVIHFFGREMRSRDRMVRLIGDARAHQEPINGSEPRLRSDVIEVRFGTNVQALEFLQARNSVVYEQGTAGVTNGPNAHRQMDTSKLTAFTDSKTGTLSNLVAEGGVVIQQYNNVAKSARAVYSGTTRIMEMTGNPTLDTPTLTISETSKLSWDEAHTKFAWEQPFKSQVRIPGAKLSVPKLVKP